jgi:hypothetical protein
LFGIDKSNEAGNYASAPPAVVEAKTGEKKKKKNKGGAEASEPERKTIEYSAEEKAPAASIHAMTSLTTFLS